jgi:hypothetical protein
VGEVVASAGADPQLMVTDIDPEAASKVRETIAVMRNRADFARADKAQSRG